MPVIVDTDTTRAVRLSATVGHSSHVVATVEQLQTWLDRRPNEYAVVLGPDVSMDAAAGLTNRLRLSRPGLSVIMLRTQTTTDLMAQAMYAGVREVIAIDEMDSLRESIERSQQNYDAIHGPSASARDNGKVITVFSPKGGVGKTTVSVNLAVALADNGTNRVALVDLDLAFGDVAITLQLIPEHTIAEAAEVEGHLDNAMLQKLLTRHDSGLMVLAAPTLPDAKDRISPALVRRVIASLRSDFDYIVVDSSPGFDEQVLSAFDETDECIVLATLDVPTVKNVKMSLETLDLLNLAIGHRHLVVNRADDEVGLTIPNVESILGMATIASFPSSVEVANATNHGRPIVLSKPDHPVSRGIRAVAASIAAVEERVPVAAGAGSEPSGRRSLLRRGKK
ncbi:MinD/ParA family protein [Nocardioides mangrovicus]|uniref:MinD/ParA family protein n=1 Tax=Nocardioides mangrovicus TaxID=2478913 RepID=A0A3L8P2G3_9ACTN|nr:AAA family ATPase [Nocardioides mangrovicus]RLV49152.1 MinD/ParA family protein [Nocardioides mangrovicus]